MIKKNARKYKMQDNVTVRRVFRDQLGRDFNKTDFREGEILKVIDIEDQYPKWGARVKSARDDALEIHLEGFSAVPLIIPYENIREVQFNPQKKRPKSAMKVSGKKTYKFQGGVEWWDNPNIVLPLMTSLIAGAWASLVWIENRLERNALNETKRLRERRKMARKALLKKTTIPEVIIDKITDQYLFSQLDKKYTKSKFRMGDKFVKITKKFLGRSFNKNNFSEHQSVEIFTDNQKKGIKGLIKYVTDYHIVVHDNRGQLWNIKYRPITEVKYYAPNKSPTKVRKFNMNSGRWTEWEEVGDSEDFWEGQLVRVVPLNGSFGPWGQGHIKKVDKDNIQVISSQNKVSVKIPIRDIGLYKYYKHPRKKRPKSAMKKSS